MAHMFHTLNLAKQELEFRSSLFMANQSSTSSQVGAKRNIFSEVSLPSMLELDSESPGVRGEERHEANVGSQLGGGPISGLGSLQFVDTNHSYVIEKFISPLQKSRVGVEIETLKAVTAVPSSAP